MRLVLETGGSALAEFMDRGATAVTKWVCEELSNRKLFDP